ncbi:MAG: DNA methyltransferase [Succinivibrio sp.]|nr:N-6 DNA methylase [Succinatimonas sp.]MDY5064131.1 DNA methyltransferase [Succinivibrio sp.]
MSTKNHEAFAFVEEWKGKGDEKQHCQQFWTNLLSDVLHCKVTNETVKFEYQVQLGHQSYIDVYLPESRVIIEQKGQNIDLFKKAKQSDGSMLSPFEQAKRYNIELPFSQKARWIVTCNFKTFLIYDMDKDLKGENPVRIELEELPTKLSELDFLKTFKNDKIIEEQALSIKAGELIGKLYDGLIKQYKDPKSENTLKSLNKLCVRLVFCLYAEDAGLFDRKDCHIFGNYIKNTETKNIRRALIDLFEVLNQDPDRNERDPYLDEELARFPYVNGNLFKVMDPQTEEIPLFTEELKTLLVEECSEAFDWADISPTIFGAVFESTLNPETRRSGGMHYTSVENIHKVIDPLFLDELRDEFDAIKQYKTERKIAQECETFQNKLASLKFLDPACGSGNFLTETYICLRRLENELILFRSKGMSTLGIEELNPVKVGIHQFYGIEINDFACAVATTAMWIAESQMLHETEEIIHREIDFLPLKSNSNIVEGNALRMDWNNVVLCTELNYIMGNPPFVGHQYRTKDQVEDLKIAFHDLAKHGKLDFVCGWYNKAVDYIGDTGIQVAFVSTNSICQGESVSILWSYLFNKGVVINFAYKSFIWNSEALDKAHVYCVVIGFAKVSRNCKKIFSDDNYSIVDNINGYLIAADNVFLEARGKNRNNLPEMTKGSQPTDGGYLLLTEKEKTDLENKYHTKFNFIKQYIGAEEFINNKKRYCLWLDKVNPSVYRNIPEILDRLNRVKELRLKSPTKSVKEQAEIPFLFTQIRQPCSDYVVIPETSSEKRKYIPIGFLNHDQICSNALRIIPNCNIYVFGILMSSTHMAWMRAVAGRLEMRYRYSPAIYNNFPFPKLTEEQIKKIEITSQSILDARAQYPDSSLADLYDPLIMPIELRKAHQANDRAVIAAYGWDKDITEEEIVANLMQMYAKR